MQLSMLRQLLSMKLINDFEYEKIKEATDERLWCGIQYYDLTYCLYCNIIIMHTTVGTQKEEIWK